MKITQLLSILILLNIHLNSEEIIDEFKVEIIILLYLSI